MDPAAYPIATVALGAELLADRVAIIQSVEESRDTSQQTFSRKPLISCSSGTQGLGRGGEEVEKIPTHKTHKDIEFKKIINYVTQLIIMSQAYVMVCQGVCFTYLLFQNTGLKQIIFIYYHLLILFFFFFLSLKQLPHSSGVSGCGTKTSAACISLPECV